MSLMRPASPLLALALAFTTVACNGGSTDETGGFNPDGPGEVIVDTGGGSAADDNDTIATAEGYAPDIQDALTGLDGMPGKINPAGDRDFYAINVEPGQTYHAFTRAFANGDPTDTVIRIYDEDSNVIGQNDDMMYRFQETDSGVMFAVDYTGTAYVEVLEFADWSNEDSGTTLDVQGGPSYNYEIYVFPMATIEFDDGNNTIAEVDALDPETFPEEAQGIQLHSNFEVQYWGQLDAEGDVDYYRLDFSADESSSEPPYRFATVSAWDINRPLNPNLTYSLLNDAGDVLASTDAATIDEDAFFLLTDVGMLIYVDVGSVYYLKVEATAPEVDPKVDPKKGKDGGKDGKKGDKAAKSVANPPALDPAETFYAVAQVTYLPALADYEVEGGLGNDTIETAATIALEESETTPGRYSAAYWGTVVSETDVDVYRLDAATLSSYVGRYFTIRAYSDDGGSLLDPKLEIMDSEGNILLDLSGDDERAEAKDPWARDWQVPSGTTGDLYLRVTPEARGVFDLSNNYMLQIITALEPLYSDQ